MIRHQLALRWFLPAAVGALTFLLIAWDVSAGGLLVAFDHLTAETLFNFGRSRNDLHRTVVFVTNLGAGDFITAIGFLNVLLLLANRDLQAAAVFAMGQWLVHRVIPFFKDQFTRPRPPFLGWTDYSFPSGHAFGSAVIYGTSLFVIWYLFRGYRFRWPTVAFLALLIVSVAASRPLFGVHYISDVVAGTTLGLAYVCVMVALGNPRGLRRNIAGLETA